MIVTLKWLSDFVNLEGLGAQEIADKFISIGFEVEDMKDLSKGMERVRVGRIVKLSKHPNADKLQICTIDLGGETVQIITAATNVFEGALVPAALDGADLPNGLKIKTSNMRGEESQGMLCSGEELCIDDSVYPNALVDGIMILDESAKEGQQIAEFLGLDDVVFDLKVLANRPDYQSVYGLARELAAGLNREFVEPKLDFDAKNVKLPLEIEVQSKNCPLYFGCVVENVQLAPSPKHVQQRLKSVGITPRNNIVDLTNYVLWEMGQPMHAFDYDKIANHKIIVRQASLDEEILCLDDNKYVLNPDILVIADSKQPIGLAGIKGGKEFSINDSTNNIVIESAIFDRVCIRRGARSLGIRTDASSRYERGVESISAQLGLNRILALISEFKIGNISSVILKLGDVNSESREVVLPLDDIKRTLGIEVSTQDVIEILKRLDICAEVKGENVHCLVPAIRADIERPADIIEEVIRFYGFEKIVPTYCENTQSISGGMNDLLKLERNCVEYMMTTGAHQVRTYGFRAPSEFDKLLLPEGSPLRDSVKIENPLSLDYSVMRTEMIGSLLDVVKLNASRKNKEVQIFEVGKIFINNRNNKDNLPQEDKILAYLTSQNVDFFNVKAITEMLASKFGLTFNYKPSQIEFMHPNICADIVLGNKKIGFVGKVHPKVTKNYEISADCFYFEINLGLLPPKKVKKVKPLPKYPSAHRDLAVVVDENVQVGGMIDVIKKTVGDILEEVELFDIYQGEQIEKGKKNIAFNLKFRKADATLTQDEVNDAFNKILARLESTFQATLRS
ncbi:MAG: phenylalanine--tRNA ligase subunit beta [Clostridia bacterium]|nr:phenylalanine--tRNA ligase subunit beta [Clostridia bacterium]